MWKAQLHRCFETHAIGLDEVINSRVDLSPLSFPRVDMQVIRRRLDVLKSMNVDGIYVFYDEKGGVYPCVVGKGSRGVAVLCQFSGREAVVKIRRLDSPVDSMVGEAEKQLRANEAGVGPKVFAYNDDAILMEYIQGRTLEEFLKEDPDEEIVKKIFYRILVKCFRLDVVLLSHNQLRDASTHVIVKVNGEAEIIDFSHAKVSPFPKNVSQFISYVINRLEWCGDKRVLYRLLVEYKRVYSVELLQRMARFLGLKPV